MGSRFVNIKEDERQINIWGRLKYIIKAKGLIFKDIANHIGAKASTVSNWVNLNKSANLVDFLEICDYLDIDPSTLLAKEGKEDIDLATLHHIDLIALFKNKQLALKTTQKLLEIENCGKLDHASKMLSWLLSDYRENEEEKLKKA